MSRHIALRIALSLLAAIALSILILVLFDWNRAKPWLSTRISEATGRPFAINGDLSIAWRGGNERESGWRNWIPWPHLSARDIRFGNPAWAQGNMAEVGELRFGLSTLALLRRQIVIPSLQLDDAKLNLLRTEEGRNNWTLKSGDPSRWQVIVKDVQFRNGTIRLEDQIRQIDASAQINTIADNEDQRFRTRWTISGSMEGETVSGEGKAGALLSLRSQHRPFPLEAQLRVGKTKIAANGTVTGLPAVDAADLQLEVSGASMAHLYPLTGVLLPHTPSFSTKGHLIRAGNTWTYRDFSGKVGGSDLAGRFVLQIRQPRPLLTGQLESRELRMQDLGPLIGSGNKKNLAKGDKNEKQPAAKALPVRDFDAGKWTSIDADVDFKAKKIVRDEDLPFEDMVASLRLQDGVLTLAPLNFGVAGGKLASDIRLDGREKDIKARLDVSARGLKLKQLFPGFDIMQASIGEMNGDVKLTASGGSVAAMLASSNGELKALISQGTVSKLLLETIGLNIGSIILTRLFGDRQVSINCMAADFDITDGVMQARGFVADTEEATVTITGGINLAQEKLDLGIHPENKKLRLFSLSSPLYVRGSFKNPDIGVDKGTIAAKAGGALVLGLTAPVATALLPLANPGNERDIGCQQLLQQARSEPRAPSGSKETTGQRN